MVVPALILASTDVITYTPLTIPLAACTECRGGQYASVQCTATTDRVCASCTKCTSDEYEAFPCYNGVDRVCRTTRARSPRIRSDCVGGVSSGGGCR